MSKNCSIQNATANRAIVKAAYETTKNYGTRIIAENVLQDNNTFTTGLNNNDLIIGPSGCGKTRGYVIPNILHTNDSFIVADTKSALYNETKAQLEAKGFTVHLIDFKNPENSTIGYSPFDYIGRYSDGSYNELAIKSITDVVNPMENEKNEPFWQQAAGEYMQWAISYMLTFLPEEEHTMDTVAKLINSITTPRFDMLIQESECDAPDTSVARLGRAILDTKHGPEKMFGSIMGILRNNMGRICAKELLPIYTNENRIDFAELGRTKTALFINISDVDRSLDSLLNLFYTQSLQALVRSADNDYEDNRLKVPVRLILDDFASSFTIPNFDNIISIIRSRDIYVSVIIQSLSQLESMYGPHKAVTIMNNCDCQIYLGGQDIETGEYFAKKCNKTLENILYMPIDQLYLFIRGQRPKQLKRFDFRNHDFEIEDSAS